MVGADKDYWRLADDAGRVWEIPRVVVARIERSAGERRQTKKGALIGGAVLGTLSGVAGAVVVSRIFFNEGHTGGELWGGLGVCAAVVQPGCVIVPCDPRDHLAWVKRQ